MKWTYAGGETSSIGFQVSVERDEGCIRFQYTKTDRSSGEKEEFDYENRLVFTPCNYGGKRWWFICGLIVNGGYCGRRVGKLYLSSGGKYFGCRHCYDLTYESCKDSHKLDRIAYKLGVTPKQFKGLFKRF